MSTPTTLATPTIHLNGTSKQSLLDDLCKAFEKLGDAHDALKECAPNGRDYYTQPAGAFELARQQHYARLNKLQDVREELEQIAIAIQS